MSGLDIASRLLLAYLLGSLSGSLLVGRVRGVDVRRLGSGNAGGTNAFRTQGWRFAIAVVLIDVVKGVLAVWVAQRGVDDGGMALRIGMAAGAAVVLGHVWPIFFGFKGGKGAATLVGALFVLWPMALLPLVSVWLLSLMINGYVGLATMLAGAVLMPVSALFAPTQHRTLWLLASVLITAFLLFTHRGNIQRLRAGNEHRFERVRWIGRLWDRFK